MTEPRKLNDAEINALILSGSASGKYEPIGLFYWQGNDTFIGVDNSSGDAWTEEFPSLESCLTWLKDKSQETSI